MGKITVVVKEPSKDPEIRVVENTLEEMQKAVGGYIEAFGGLFEYPITTYCNEEGKLDGLQPNFRLGNDIVVGPVFVCGTDEEGDNISLTDAQCAKVMYQLRARSIN